MSPPLRRCAASPQGDGALRPAEPDPRHPLEAGIPRRRYHRGTPASGSLGFTLLELMIVVAIVALATAGVSLSLRDTNATALDNEATRLAALLESARAQSRTSGVPVRWRSTAEGFEFQGITANAGATDSLARPRTWLNEDTRARLVQPPDARELLLGPEPLIGAQRIELRQGDRRLVLGTDGLAPFSVVPDVATP